MKILIVNETNHDKYFAIINDIIKREKLASGDTTGIVLDICDFLNPVMNLNSENKLGQRINPDYFKYKTYVKKYFENQNFPLHTLRKKSKILNRCAEIVIKQIIHESGTTTLATIYNKSFAYQNYPHRIRKKLEKLISQIYLEYIEFLSEDTYDRIYIPSGKNAWANALERALLINSPSSEIYYYDAFGSSGTYFCERYKPTDLLELQKAILRRENLTQEQQKVAEQWFENQGSSKSQNFYLNVGKAQEKKFESSTRFTIFTSSEDEFVGLPDWSESSFYSQYEALQLAAKHLLDQNSDGAEVVIRYHPHLKYKSFSDNVKALQSAMKFKDMGCLIILADEDISARSLIELSEKVVVWNSTVGIESAYLGKPTYYLANSIYSPLKTAAYVQKTSDLEIAIDPEGISSRVLLYGYFMATTSFPLASFDFYDGRRYRSSLHYLCFGNHRGMRMKFTLNSNKLLMSAFRFFYLKN